jgi:hypothetical protein
VAYGASQLFLKCRRLCAIKPILSANKPLSHCRKSLKRFLELLSLACE